ncbi:MAG TPA: amidohydrolase [Thermoanaerobacterales bacterium]|nr:amidohydrolase [Thermoanaerobacterales bacterium]
MDFLAEAREMQNKLTGLRRHFHQNPEVSGKEFETAKFIICKLKELGLEVIENVGKPLPGVIGILRGNNRGKTVALRADMDALAVREQNDVPYRSKFDGIMHACGHDAHMAILLGAAELLSKHKNELMGNVKFIFQPSEEIYGGALPMIKDGALENVDAIFGLHVDPAYQVGEIGICYGETLAASDRIIFKVKGKSSHGADPHEGIDAIVIAAHIIVALQSLITRQKDPSAPAVLSFGIIQGGNQPNAIAEEVLVRGILRTLNPALREKLNVGIEKIVRGISESFDANCEFMREKSYDSLINDNEKVNFLKEVASEIIGSNNVKHLEKPRMIVEDFAYYLQRVPGAYFFLGCGNKKKGIIQPLHNSKFNIDEDSLQIGVALETALAIKILRQI